jgi:glutamyl/glutaminyl-tRNA synthetase
MASSSVPDGKKMSKRAEGSTVASLRDAGIPPEAVRRYLEQLGLPKHDVSYDLPRIRRYAIETIGRLSDDELAARVGVPVSAVPVLRGARDLVEARANADVVLNAPGEEVSLGEKGSVTLARFRELRASVRTAALSYESAKTLVRELKAVGGDLYTLRVALTGRDRGPELAAVVAALDRDETLRRLDAAV